MKYINTLLATTLAVSVLCSVGLNAHSDNNPEPKALLDQEAKVRIGVFAKTLGKTLKGALSEGGFPNGIAVCKEKAPEIAANLSTDGWQIGRTSLKIRNSQNAPDKWEQKVLDSFEEKQQQGAAVTSLMHSEVVEVDGQMTFRFMKAIPTKGMCLSCHGSKLDPSVAETLQKDYPHDKATGFSTSDIRGAFTVSKKLF